MRETNENMIELLEVSRSNDILSVLVRQNINQENLKVRFGISLVDFNCLKRILDYRPFENSGVGLYRYYFVLSYRKDPKNLDMCYMKIRIEQLDRDKQYEFLVSQKLMANILWLDTLTDKNEIETMIEY